jgi:glycogen debranching enzyme
VWPWLLGAFVEAWLRVRPGSPRVRAEARERFLAPLEALAIACGGHVAEIADGDSPHTPRGCRQQAWSVGGLLRIQPMLGD